MKKLFAAAFALACSTSLFAAGQGKFRSAERPIPQQYIVVLRDDVVTNVAGLADELARSHAGLVDHVYDRALKGFSVRMTDGMARKLADNPLVQFVEEDGVVSIDTTQSNAPWGLDRIDQRDRPLNGTFNYVRTGSGVKAYIIDTGILTTHTQFGGRAISGYDAVDGALPATDCNGHGTHVAGTVGGSTYGVAKGVTLVAVRVLDCNGSGTTSGVIAGVNWVTSNHGAGQPAVANMSLGGGASSSLDTAVRNSIADGVTYAIAAGNGNSAGVAQNACNYSPARVTEGITVSATNSSDTKASWANYGSCVDIFAPGVSILSAWYTSTSATNTISGTSMATPHVAGVAALYLQGSTSASPATVHSALINNASLNKVSSAGSGSPNRLLFTNY
ncbi:MAG TPA: S8 family peptidase [Thermoanaerobaculia bacterium]|jgi:subtilisin family serine protease